MMDRTWENWAWKPYWKICMSRIAFYPCYVWVYMQVLTGRWNMVPQICLTIRAGVSGQRITPALYSKNSFLISALLIPSTALKKKLLLVFHWVVLAHWISSGIIRRNFPRSAFSRVHYGGEPRINMMIVIMIRLTE